jgi:hypothetical protein
MFGYGLKQKVDWSVEEMREDIGKNHQQWLEKDEREELFFVEFEKKNDIVLYWNYKWR